jgi:protein Mpv17
MDEDCKPEVLQVHWLSRVWNSYSRMLDERPVLVKSLTSLFGFMIGDLLAQSIVGNPYNVWRTVRLVLFGVIMDGPVGHVWYTTLDEHVWANKPKSNRAVLTKMLLDQLVWAPFFSCVFFAFIGTLEGRPDKILSSIQRKLVPMLLTNYAVWPIAHIINFKYIPSSQRILYINCCQILWSAYMSNCQAR